jgi:hypothetical protein
MTIDEIKQADANADYVWILGNKYMILGESLDNEHILMRNVKTGIAITLHLTEAEALLSPSPMMAIPLDIMTNPESREIWFYGNMGASKQDSV